MITRGDMKLARHRLRMNVREINPEAVAYIDWDAFEGVLEAVLATPNPTNEMIHRVFRASVAKAVQAYVRDNPRGPTN